MSEAGKIINATKTSTINIGGERSKSLMGMMSQYIRMLSGQNRPYLTEQRIKSVQDTIKKYAQNMRNSPTIKDAVLELARRNYPSVKRRGEFVDMSKVWTVFGGDGGRSDINQSEIELRSQIANVKVPRSEYMRRRNNRRK